VNGPTRKQGGLALALMAAALIGAAAVPPARAGATTNTLYVSSGGSDTSNCQTKASPCASITYALTQAQAGDLIDLINIPALESLTIDKDITLYVPFAALGLPDDITIDSGVTLTLEEDCDATLSGDISGDGSLVENDPGGCYLNLSPGAGSNTYMGTTDVVNGGLVLTSSGSLPTATPLTVGPDGTVSTASSGTEIGSLAGSGTVNDRGTLTVDSTGISTFTGSIVGGSVVMSHSPSLLMTGQPSEEVGAPDGSATFSAPTVSGATPTVGIQWQASTDGGGTWTGLVDGSGVTGSGTNRLTVSGVRAAQSGSEYRAQFTLGAAEADGGSAALFVSATSPAPTPPFSVPPGPSEPLGTYTMALSFQPGAAIGGGCIVVGGRAQPRCGGLVPDTESFTDPVSGVKYTIDASGASGDEGVTISGYEVNTADLAPPAPSGVGYVIGFAVSFSPAPLPAGDSISLTITDPAIQAGDTIYEVNAGPPASLVPVATASTGGTVTVNFSDDPVFIIGHAVPVAPPIFQAPTTTTTLPRVKLIRLGGSDRIATAMAISQYDFSQGGSARAVVLGRDDLFADDLAGSPFASSVGGPLLLTDPSYLDPRTAAEIARVLPAGGTVYLLGQTSALSGAVESSLTAAGYRVVRVGGPDRYSTAADVALADGSPAAIFEADGTQPGGAVSAAPAVISQSGAILLTAGTTQSRTTAGYLTTHAPDSRYAVGAAPVSADPDATALAGADEDSTAVVVAQRFFADPTVVGIATSGAFPDALTGAATSEAGHGPTLLVPADGPLPAEVAAYLEAHPSVTTIIVYGGTAAVSDSVAAEALQSAESAS